MAGAGVTGLGSFEPVVLGAPLGRVCDKGELGSRESLFMALVREISLWYPFRVVLFIPAALELDQSEVKFIWLS
jgi:hypothetical protein